jgi:hypothetical protein
MPRDALTLAGVREATIEIVLRAVRPVRALIGTN